MPDQVPRKNVVLISLDDSVAFWKYKTVFGEVLQTPNLDRICAQSTAFHNAYCQAPICSPSRASFMSGKSPHHTGVAGTDKNYFEKIAPESLMPAVLKRNGFFCSSGGKMARGFGPLPGEIHSILYSDRRRRFTLDRRKVLYDDGVSPDGINRIEFGGFRGGQATVDEKDDVEFYDHQVAASAEMFLNRYNKKKPFYREVGFSGPHGPWTTPRRYKEMYDIEKMCKPPEWAGGFDESAFMEAHFAPNIADESEDFWRRSLRNYFSALTHVDHHLGHVWDTIKTSRHADNTLVVILSDHGMHLGERDRFRKHALWEQVANVPLIIHDPDQPEGQIITDPVALVDVSATVMDYIDLPPLPGSVGRSLRPLMKGARDPDRAIPTFLDDSAGVRQGNYRFIRYGDGSTQFHDIEKDWWQTTDLGPNHPDYAAMRACHAACCAEYGLEIW